jgi:hypothetical protein
MAFPQFAELWKLIDLLVRKDFRQANLGECFDPFFPQLEKRDRLSLKLTALE